VEEFIRIFENLFEHNNGMHCSKQSLLFSLITVECSRQMFF